mgnify:CR=1 FL=1
MAALMIIFALYAENLCDAGHVLRADRSFFEQLIDINALIETGKTFGSSFEAALQPQILLWLLAHYALDKVADDLSVGVIIAAGEVFQCR